MTLSATTNRTPSEADDGTERLLRKARYSTGSSAARIRRQVVLDHQTLAVSIAHRYDRRGLERADLEQVALLGLVQAVRRYRPGEGSSFVAFAIPTITGELKRHFRDHGWAVRPPRHLQEQSLVVRACADRLAQDLGRAATAADVAEHTKIPRAQVERAQAVDGQYVARSLDAPVDRADGAALSDTLGATSTDLARVEAFATLRPALRELTARERLIIRLRFVENLTQRQIGQRIGVSQMQVSRLLADILGRLRRALAVDDNVSAAS